jgi:hypothetical protein
VELLKITESTAGKSASSHEFFTPPKHNSVDPQKTNKHETLSTLRVIFLFSSLKMLCE